MTHNALKNSSRLSIFVVIFSSATSSPETQTCVSLKKIKILHLYNYDSTKISGVSKINHGYLWSRAIFHCSGLYLLLALNIQATKWFIKFCLVARKVKISPKWWWQAKEIIQWSRTGEKCKRMVLWKTVNENFKPSQISQNTFREINSNYSDVWKDTNLYFTFFFF